MLKDKVAAGQGDDGFSFSNRPPLFVIPSEAEGSAVPRTLLGNVFLEHGVAVSLEVHHLVRPLTERVSPLRAFSPSPPVVYTQEVNFVVGTWLSLVEHSLGVRGVGSSNLPVPTKLPTKKHVLSR